MSTDHEAGTCWYCKRRPAAASATYRITLHGNARVSDYRREGIYDKYTIGYETLPLEVPRCTHCGGVHDFRTAVMSILGLAALALAVIFMPIQDWAIGEVVVCVLAWSLATCVGAGAGWFLGVVLTAGQARLESYGRQAPLVKQLIERGWKTSKPTSIDALKPSR